MTKHVFTDPGEVAHRWAHAAQDSARYRDNFYFTGPAIFSYGSHFLCGYRFADRVFAINADSYSVTTSRHMREVRSAVYGDVYAVPNLTDLHRAGVLQAIEPVLGASRAARSRNRFIRQVRKAFESWLAGNFAATEADSLAFLFDGLGYTDSQRQAMLAKLGKQAERDKAKEKARQEAQALAWAKRRGAMSDSDFRAAIPADHDSASQDRQLKEFRSSHRVASRAKLGKLKAKLWGRVAELESHIAGRDKRLAAQTRATIAAELRAWRADGMTGNRHAESFPFFHFHPFAARYHVGEPAKLAPVATRRIERALAEHESAERRAAYDAWQAGTGKRPSYRDWPEGSPERSAIYVAVKLDRDEWAERAQAWLDDESLPDSASPDASPPGWYDLPDSSRDPAHSKLSQAMLGEGYRRAQRDKAAKREAELKAWRDGTGSRLDSYSDSRGGALLRIVGDTLETSHGASVPLSHAIRAFPFIKGCREAGRGWKANGRRIRVGHYELDSIDREGNFIAGCHNISWSEVLRVAELAGVADQPAIALPRSHSGPRQLEDVIAGNNAGGDSWQSNPDSWR